MFQLFFYVPSTHLKEVKTAIFTTNAGTIGNYDSCCWQTLGEGQFRPLEGNNAFIGETGKLEAVPEYRVELVCTAEQIHDAVEAMQEAHPYEEPAYGVIKLEDF